MFIHLLFYVFKTIPSPPFYPVTLWGGPTLRLRALHLEKRARKAENNELSDQHSNSTFTNCIIIIII